MATLRQARGSLREVPQAIRFYCRLRRRCRPTFLRPVWLIGRKCTWRWRPSRPVRAWFPFLQFGEVNGGISRPTTCPLPVHDYHGMPFYDDYTTSQFLSEHGYALPVFSTNNSDPAKFSDWRSYFFPGLVSGRSRMR